MARVVRPDTFIPLLRFRYKAEIVGQAPGLSIYGRSVDLPKWTNKDGWCNPLNIRCYNFEGITVRELSEIKPENINLIISILDPTGSPIYKWNLIGDIISIDYGNLDWGIDDVTESTLVFMPRECVIAFELNNQKDE
jgi:hypothetical protein